MSPQANAHSKWQPAKHRLRFAVVISLAVPSLLAALAFWPERAWRAPPRPRLHAPVVLDELIAVPLPPADFIPGHSPPPR